MPTVTAMTPARMREASISAVVIRADGRIEDLGVVSYWHKNPLRRLAWRIRQQWKRVAKWLRS